MNGSSFLGKSKLSRAQSASDIVIKVKKRSAESRLETLDKDGMDTVRIKGDIRPEEVYGGDEQEGRNLETINIDWSSGVSIMNIVK